MIRKVQRITSFGVFEDFTWPIGLHEFKQFNFIFGWNYSGKTTFSRAFRCFELLKRHPDFDKADVHLHCEDGAVHMLSSTTGPHHYRVFNVDFVRDNIRFDEGTTEPILILGASDIAKQDELKKNQDMLFSLREEIQVASKARHEIEAGLDKAFIATARDNIKIPLKRLNYDKNRFATKVDTCKESPKTWILSDSDFARALDTYNSTDKKPSIDSLPQTALASLSSLSSRAGEVASRSVKSVAIQVLTDRPELEQWVNKGRTLHEGKTQCQFCGEPLPTDLLSRLSDHFSTEYDKLMEDLETLERDLVRAKAETPHLPYSGSFYAELSASFEGISTELDRLFKDRRKSIDLLLETVYSKRIKAFTALPAPIVNDSASAINNSLNEVASLITIHNKRSQEFHENREAAFVRLEAHWASRFVLKEDYISKVNQVRDLSAEEEQKSIVKEELVLDIKRLERELSEAVKGAETINDLMRAYFGKDDIRISVSEGKRFRITRNDLVAKNLSEGERSAVAFVYFMTRLLDEKPPLAETTVIVDDPIGSLDANHLFNTYSFVKTKLAGCHQLFVLTHNYEFYSLIKEWALDERGNKADKAQTTWKKWSVYLVRRKDDGMSTLEVIPPELLKYRSEYHYLFARLLKFQNDAGADYDYLFSLPNVARRFMEAFGGIMIPTYQGLHAKLPRLIPDAVQSERVWKFINDYSHNNSLNRSLVIPDVSECKVVVAACLKAVEQWNPTYYKDLVEAIQ